MGLLEGVCRPSSLRVAFTSVRWRVRIKIPPGNPRIMSTIGEGASRLEFPAVPKVSVLMPVFNAEPYLQAAIDSVLAQSFDDWELILVDDGSTDGSRAICEAATSNPRIRLLSRLNTGIAGALNDGLSIARGAYIARLDADDVATPAWLQLLSRHLDSRPNCVIVAGCATQIDHAGRLLGAIRQPIDHDTIILSLLNGRGSAVIHSCCMYRATTALAVGCYSTRCVPAEDLDFFLRMADHGQLENLPETLVHVRRHVASSTALSDQKRIHQLKLQILQEAYARRGIEFDPAKIPLMNHAASVAEAYAIWLLIACRSGEWRTAVYYAGRTAHAMLMNPTALGRVSKRILYAISPIALRNLVAAWRSRTEYQADAV